MKSWKSRCLAGFSAILCMFFFSFSALAGTPHANDGYECDHHYRTFGDKMMNYGVGNYGRNRRYFWMSGFDSKYQGYIRNAVSKWVNTTSAVGVTTSISIRETTNQSSALFEFVNAYLGTNTLGRTSFYMYSERIYLTSDGALPQNYGWTRCEISVTTLESHYGANNGAAQKEATIAHELGHGMGLSHQNYRKASIMCQTGWGRTATRADATDCRTINHIYG